MINNFFTNFIDIIDAVCLIAKSSSNRLTDKQIYIISWIISIFGKEITENFNPMLIYCDGSQRGILDRLNDKDEESIFG